MAALNFPTGTYTGQTYTANGRTYVFDATKSVWNAVGQTVSTGATGGTSTTSATDITLTSSSTQVQLVTMTAAGQSVILPSATTMSKGSSVFEITASFTSFSFYVKNSAGTLVAGPIGPGGSLRLSLEDNSTSAGVWTQQTAVTLKGTYDTLSISSVSYYLYGSFVIMPMSATSCIVLHWGQNGSNTIVTATGVTLSGSTFSFGTPVTLYNGSGTVNQVGGCSLSSTAAVATVAMDNVSATIWSLTLSGNTVTNAGSSYIANSPSYYSNLYAFPYAMSSTEAVVWLGYYNGSPNYTYNTLVPYTINGATITAGSAYTLGSEFGQYAGPKARVVKTGTGVLVCAFHNASNSTQKIQAFTLASNVLTAGTAVTIPATNQSSIGNYADACYSPAANTAIFLNGGWSLRVTNSSNTISSWSEAAVSSGPESVSVISGGQVLISPYTVGYGNSSGFQGGVGAIGSNNLMSIGKAAMLDSTTGVAIGRYSSSGTNYLAAQLLKVI